MTWDYLLSKMKPFFAVLGALAAIAGILALGVEIYGVIPRPSEPPRGELELLRPDVQTPVTEYRELPDETLTAIAGTSPRIDFLLFNRGDATVVTTSLRLAIRDYAEFSGCIVGGGDGGPVEISKTYRVVLPVAPLPEERSLTFKFEHEIPAGRTEKPAIEFEQPADLPGGGRLYLLDAYLRSNESADSEWSLGSYLIALPAITRHGSYFPETRSSLQDLHSGKMSLTQSWCYRQNLASLRRLIERSAHRSAELDDLANVRPHDRYDALLDRTPAAAAAERLARSSDHGYEYAIFAAEQTQDPVLTSRIRRLVARRHLEVAKERTGVPGLGIVHTRRSILAFPTPEAAAHLKKLGRSLPTKP